MDDTVKMFLSAGRSFRHKVAKGPFFVIEKDEVLSSFLERWLDGINQKAVVYKSISKADSALSDHPKCVIVGLDDQPLSQIEGFLTNVDHNHPEIVSIVYTSSDELAFSLRASFPRLTVLCKGEGLADFLSELDSEVHVKEFVA